MSSIVPVTPKFDSATLKSFWSRPEGKSGMVFVLASAAAGLYGASFLLPWAIAFATDTLHLLFLCLALGGALYTVSNKTFRAVVSNLFQLGMRRLTGMVIEIDPIGILRNNLDRMRERNEELARAIEGCNGAKRRLETQITKNEGAVTHDKGLISEIERKLQTRTPAELDKQRLLLSRQTYLSDAGRKIKSNDTLSGILAQTSKMYQMLCRWQQLAEYNIENTAAEIENAQSERDTILASYRSLGFARKLIKGDPEELKMVNASLEYLAQDNAMKLGAMEDFARYSQKFLDNMDLEQGADAAEAEKMLQGFEQKLLAAGSSGTTVPELSSTGAPEAVPVPARKYKDLM